MQRVAMMAAAVAVLAWGCDDPFAPDPWGDRLEALESHRATWAEAAVGSYRFEESKTCECVATLEGRPVVVTVEGGEITSVVRADDGEPVSEELWIGFDTVEEIFALIESVIEERAHQFEVEYDGDLGHPTLVSFDIDPQVADDEMLIRVEDLEELAAGETVRTR